jgi:hypothetical protein
MYTIQLDTVKNFECSLKIQGASLKKSKVNLVIETNDLDIRCRGNINESGKVSIPVRKLKGILDEEVSGNMYLEVIADDTYFTPYKTTYKTEYSKKVAITEDIKITDVSFEEKPIITTDIQESVADETINNHAANIIIKFNKSKVDIFNEKDKAKVNSLIREYITENKIEKQMYDQIIETIISSLSELI